MNFGDKLKLLRKEQELTQPELADKIGIEQSFLSKLETGKSFPSADNFELILQAFKINTEILLEGVDPAQVFKQLRQIPKVSQYLDKYHKQQKSQRKKWLLGSALFFVIGVTSFMSGIFGIVFPETFYNYYSQGIVLEGEPKEIFNEWGNSIDKLEWDNNGRKQMEELRLVMEKRRDEEFLLASDYRGTRYNIAVDGGSRTYYLRSDKNIDRSENRWLIIIGILFLTLGITGLSLEQKFFK